MILRRAAKAAAGSVSSGTAALTLCFFLALMIAGYLGLIARRMEQRPEDKKDGEIAEFKSGVEKILERRPVPVVPLALRGLWGSIFSRRDSALGRSRLPRRFWSRIGLAAGAPVAAENASAEALEVQVRALRGADA